MKKTTNLKWFIVGSFLALGLIGVIYASIYYNNPNNSKPNKASVTSKILVEEKDYDFGSIAIKGGDVSHSYKLLNEGTEPIVIKKVYTSCMCTTANVISKSGKAGPYGMQGHSGLSRQKVEIAPGEEFEVEAVFDPSAHGLSGIGYNQRSIYRIKICSPSNQLTLWTLYSVLQ